MSVHGDGKATAAGSCFISNISSGYTVEIGEETSDGAGVAREITCTGDNFSGKYLVVQITEGSGESAKVSVVMVQADETVTVSYQNSGAQLYVLITDGMPNLTGTGAMDATIYASANG